MLRNKVEIVVLAVVLLVLTLLLIMIIIIIIVNPFFFFFLFFFSSFLLEDILYKASVKIRNKQLDELHLLSGLLENHRL